MFKNAVNTMLGFTRPVMFISRTFKSENVTPGLASMFFVNDEGAALTCKHVAHQILQAEAINQNYAKYRKEVRELQIPSSQAHKKQMRQLESKYKFQSNITVTMKCQFRDVPTPMTGFTVKVHPDYDLALIQFHGAGEDKKQFEHMGYNPEHIVLLDDDTELSPGKSLCRLGFPFPEFSNYKYDQDLDDIVWTSDPSRVPAFPLDGIMTRNLGDEKGNIYGIEMSTPGLRGQSGGPLFDAEGRICGMQSATKHLHLGFDMVNAQMKINGAERTINNQPFLHVGHCIHVKVIKEFLNQNNIPYRTA